MKIHQLNLFMKQWCRCLIMSGEKCRKIKNQALVILHEKLFSLVRLEAKPHKGFFIPIIQLSHINMDKFSVFLPEFIAFHEFFPVPTGTHRY